MSFTPATLGCKKSGQQSISKSKQNEMNNSKNQFFARYFFENQKVNQLKI